jgi:flagellar basal body-associated protein FliL
MSGASDDRKGSKGSLFAKIVVVLAIAFCAGLGLCGLSFVAASHGFKSNQEFGVDSIGIAGFSLIVMILSALGLVVAVVVRVMAAIFGSFSSKQRGSEPQTLFGDEDDEHKPQ